jgi:hypothetical protein
VTIVAYPQLWLELTTDLCVFNSAWRAVRGESARIHAIGKRYVIHLPALIGCDLLPDPLSDLAVARAVACQADHTNRRRHPWSRLPIPASGVVALLALRSRRADISIKLTRGLTRERRLARGNIRADLRGLFLRRRYPA